MGELLDFGSAHRDQSARRQAAFDAAAAAREEFGHTLMSAAVLSGAGPLEITMTNAKGEQTVWGDVESVDLEKNTMLVRLTSGRVVAVTAQNYSGTMHMRTRPRLPPSSEKM